MRLLLDSFWRAAFYALHPRVIALSLLPLVIVAVTTLGLGKFYWNDVYDAVDGTLRHFGLIEAFHRWLGATFGPKFNTVLVSMLIVAMAVVVIVPVTLLLAALCVSPAAVEMVARRRFPLLERRHGGSWLKGMLWSAACTLVALVAVAATMWMWLFPPLALVVPPLIWGWLTSRVMSFDALSEHASVPERRALMAAHRWPLLVAGLVAGFLCGLPSLLWTFSMALFVVWPLMMVAAIWMYTLIFAFAALWFTHYLLAALHALRTAEQSVEEAAAQRRAMTRLDPADVVELEPVRRPGAADGGAAGRH